MSVRTPRVTRRQTDMPSDLALQQTGDGGRASRPALRLDIQPLATGARQRVKARAARIFRLTPLGVEPAGPLEPLERGQQRSGIDFEDPARHLFYTARDPEAVHRLQAERFENQQVEGALDDVGAWLFHDDST